jgi:Met-zincin/Domain of unknown function (DUF5117)/Domain of unknown function (DUF5118)
MAASPAAKHPAAGAKHGAKHPPAAPQPYAKFVKGAQVTPGLIPIIRKSGKVYLALSPAQLGKDFIATSVPSSGLGGLGPAQGEPYVAPARILHFERVGNQVVLRWPNSYTVTRPGSPQATGVRQSLPNSIIAVVAVAAQDASHVVISADPFLGDIADLAGALNEGQKKPGQEYSLDAKRTLFLQAKAFPLNDMLRVDQSWVSPKATDLDNAPDSRSVEVRMTYNLIAAPDDGYVPRIYDPRVGYFSMPLMNFATDDELQRSVHYITRWSFGKRTSPGAFKATHPIVFYLSDDIPAQYRDTVRQALLTWGQAFTRVGIDDAVQVQDQPHSPGWDPDDIRHNMVRWIDTSSPAYGAEALLITDPRTGEELNVGVDVDAMLGILGRHTYKYLIAPARGLPDTAAAEQNFTDDFVRYVVLHESGHDMGLQHNFIGSMAYGASDLQSKAFTEKNGIASSVMEYLPFNLWPQGTPQGDYVQLVLGPYDYYAIRYGYGYVPGTPQEQLPTLRRWASRWADPRFRFASDEDADQFMQGRSIDPRVRTWDLTNDPLQWCAAQESLMHRLMNTVNQRFPQAGMPYDQARDAFMAPLQLDLRCATMAADVIGGEYLSRSLEGDPHAVAPLTPVPIAAERSAWSALRSRLFSDSAWKINPAVLSTLTYSEDSSLSDEKWGYNPPPRHDVPVATIVGNAQLATLHALFSPLRMQRLDDMSTKYAQGATMSLPDLFDWAQTAIFGGIASGGAHDGLIRRNLQTAYARLLTHMWIAPVKGTPADGQALARLELQSLAHEAGTGAPLAASEVERAHLRALAALAQQALQVRATTAAPFGASPTGAF